MARYTSADSLLNGDQRVLITGAGGFIGGRVAEALHCLGLATVRAGVRRWASAARVGRLPVHIVQCNVVDPVQIRAAVQDVSAVVHCAFGPRNVTVDGTRNMLEAALAGGVERFVHLSTVDVYGNTSGEIDEGHPHQYTGNQYGDSKIDAEKLCWEFIEKGLPVCILRPTIVYGPFSKSWTIEFAQRLQAGPWLLPEQYCQGICNLLYIDDLVSAILLALQKKEAIGEVFNINGPERIKWSDYFRALNTAMGLPELTPKSTAVSRSGALLMAPVRSSARFLLKHFQEQIMAIYQRHDFLKATLRRVENMIRKTPTNAEFKLYSKGAVYDTAKASKHLGYEPIFTMDEGIRLTVAWLEHHGLLRDCFRE